MTHLNKGAGQVLDAALEVLEAELDALIGLAPYPPREKLRQELLNVAIDVLLDLQDEAVLSGREAPRTDGKVTP